MKNFKNMKNMKNMKYGSTLKIDLKKRKYNTPNLKILAEKIKEKKINNVFFLILFFFLERLYSIKIDYSDVW